VPAILIVLNVMYACSAYPFGKFSDNGGRRRLLIWGIGLLIASDLVLALAGNIWLVGLGAAIWGLHMGATQGLLSVLVADAAPADLRGTAFGVFNLVSGLALLAASVLAGSLWTAFGPAMTFYAGAAIAAVALLGLLAKKALCCQAASALMKSPRDIQVTLATFGLGTSFRFARPQYVLRLRASP